MNPEMQAFLPCNRIRQTVLEDLCDLCESGFAGFFALSSGRETGFADFASELPLRRPAWQAGRVPAYVERKVWWLTRKDERWSYAEDRVSGIQH